VGLRAGLDRCVKSRPPTGIRSPDHPARRQSLYRLSYPGPTLYLLSYPGPHSCVVRAEKSEIPAFDGMQNGSMFDFAPTPLLAQLNLCE